MGLEGMVRVAVSMFVRFARVIETAHRRDRPFAIAFIIETTPVLALYRLVSLYTICITKLYI